MKEILALLLVTIAMDGNANELNDYKNRAIKKIEQKAMKIKIVKDINDLTTYTAKNKELRIRPGKISYKYEEKDYKFNAVTNGKDSFKINLKISF